MGVSVIFWLMAAGLATPAETSTYHCLDDTVFTVTIAEETAIVRFKDGEYRLPRRRSSIADKYATEEATLYLDGDFAAFATNDRPLPGCNKLNSDQARKP